MNKRNPCFIGIGVQKGGTTWVYQQLRNHPQIGFPRMHGRKVKEMHFVNKLKITLDRYLEKISAVDTYKVGEITPNYIATPYAPAFIKTHFPNTKLFVIFRNPADRAFSHYKDHLFYEKIPKDVGFMQAFREGYPKKELDCFSIKSKGMYGDQLELWQRYFDKEQLKVMFYDDLVIEPAKFIQEIYGHIGVEKNYLPTNYKDKVVKRYNKAFDNMVFDVNDKKEVSNFYKDQIQKLSDLTGRKLEWN